MVMPIRAAPQSIAYKEIHARWPNRFWGIRGIPRARSDLRSAHGQPLPLLGVRAIVSAAPGTSVLSAIAPEGSACDNVARDQSHGAAGCTTGLTLARYLAEPGRGTSLGGLRPNAQWWTMTGGCRNGKFIWPPLDRPSFCAPRRCGWVWCRSAASSCAGLGPCNPRGRSAAHGSIRLSRYFDACNLVFAVERDTTNASRSGVLC